jgi:hypothetical protein
LRNGLTGGNCQHFAAGEFLGCDKANGAILWRAIRIGKNMLEILDLAEGSDKTLRANETLLENQPAFFPWLRHPPPGEAMNWRPKADLTNLF